MRGRRGGGGDRAGLSSRGERMSYWWRPLDGGHHQPDRPCATSLPEYTFVESGELNPAHAPAAVVFTVSAIAPLTESDCALIDLAAGHTDLVIGVVSKIDAHRNWREVLAADRALLTQHAPRYTEVHWVGAAAAPDLGEARVDELVGLLRQRLSDPAVAQRNQLRARESRLLSTIERYRAAGDASDRRARVSVLHETRDDILRRTAPVEERAQHRAAWSAQAGPGAARAFRAQSLYGGEGELAEDAAQLSRRGIGSFESHVRTRVREVVEEVDEGITEQLARRGDRTAPARAAGDRAAADTADRRAATEVTSAGNAVDDDPRRRLRARRGARGDPDVRRARSRDDRRRSGGGRRWWDWC